MRYPGGKGKSYHNIINILPPHRVYIETHLGGGSVLRQKKPAAVNIGVDLDPAVIRWWQELFPALATYVEADAVDFLASHHFVGDELVYCDPPYLPRTRRRNPVYRHDYCESDHIRLLNALRKLPCRVVVSGYASELYDSCLAEWVTRTFTAGSRRGIREEKLWFNFEPPGELHDGRHLGRNFRERQTIKRRLLRLQKRIAALPPCEQSALFSALDDILRDRGGDICPDVDSRQAAQLGAICSALLPSGVSPSAPRPMQMSLFAALGDEIVGGSPIHPPRKGPQQASSAYLTSGQRRSA